MSGAAPGWYHVGDGGPRRYWDGRAWTKHVEQPVQPQGVPAASMPASPPKALRRRVQRLAGLSVAGLVLLVTATAVIVEVFDDRRGWVAACLAFVTAFVTLSAGWFEYTSRGGEERDPGPLMIVLPVIWVLLLLFVVAPVSGSS